MARVLAILITTAILVQSSFGGLSGAVVLCIDGHHQSTPTCEQACTHADAPLPSPRDEHQHDDGCCRDIEFLVIDVVATPRHDLDGVTIDLPPALPVSFQIVSLPLGSRAPPILHDSSGRHRLALLSCARLNV